MNIHIAKKWPEKVVKRSFIKGHSFPYRLYNSPVLNVFVFDAFTGVNTVGNVKMNKLCW